MSADNKNTTPTAASQPSNFLRTIIESDLGKGTYQRAGMPSVITRFPPEPNGYLHIGHAKSICLNFGLAEDYKGRCHLRFDDTNPTKEDQEFVDTIKDSVQWLGFSWEQGGVPYLHFASDYFDTLYEMACGLIEAGHAYVDSQPPEEMAKNRGTFNQPGVESPYRNRPPAESLDLFQRMKAGEFPDGAHVLRAKIDMASPNMNMRDPVIYRIRHASHHRTGDKWNIYPMYDYTHPISDALEKITHSICTLEFQDHRPFYDWILERLTEKTTLPDGRVVGGFLEKPLPHQYEFARLNLTYTITSKRKLLQLVEEKRVNGWDDPRMPTIVGIRRRGYTPEAIRLFCERIGVAKADGWIDISTLEGSLRDDLDPKAPRAAAVLHPLRLIIDNYPEGQVETCTAPVHPHYPERGERQFNFSREIWIEQDDFMVEPVKGYRRLYPGNRVRLRCAYIVECTGFDRDAAGNVIAVHANYLPDSRSGTETSQNYKVRGTIHWVSASDAVPAEVRLYDRLFAEAMPDANGRDFRDALNPDSLQVVDAYLEPGLAKAVPGDIFQFERQGYFVADLVDSLPGKPVFNRAVTLRDSWAKDQKKK